MPRRQLHHHKQQELCTSRAAYRQGRKLTAVKVYTINNESQHLLIFGVPKINLRTELKNLCQKYGDIGVIAVTNDYEVELFTECYHVSYQRIQSARIAKKLIDDRSFYGGILHVCYAPEFETVEETRAKLLQRRKDVFFKTKSNANSQYQDPGKHNEPEYVEIDPCSLTYEDDEETTNLEVLEDENETTTSYDVKVITAPENPDEPQDNDNITTIEITSTQPVLKRKFEETLESTVGELQSASEVKIIKKVLHAEAVENRIIYRKQ